MKSLKSYIQNNLFITVRFILFFIIMTGMLFSCGPKERISFYNEDAVLLIDYMKNDPDNFSAFLSVCDVGGISGALKAFNPYGNKFTLFLPDNTAINEFIAQSSEYGSMAELLADVEFCRIFCRYHLVNSAYRVNDFPLGALKDTTATGDFISVSFQANSANSETFIYLNNEAKIITPDIEAVNGIIHIIDKPLTPITFSSYDLLKRNPDFSIITETFEKTGLIDTMGLLSSSKNGDIIRNYYTLMVEPDSVFNKRGISDFDDLKNRFATSGLPLDDRNNALYQFAAYHIIEGSYFLDGLSTGVYNTYASFPVSIYVSTGITLNNGFRVIDTLVSGTDTSLLNYVPVNLNLSNNPSKNGPVHIITELLELYKPATGTITYQFMDEPLIAEARKVLTQHIFDDPEKMQKLSWTGTKYLIYENSTGESIDASSKDCLFLDGTFVVNYELPKTPSGTYNIVIRAHSKLTKKATIQVYLDDKRVGSTFSLNSSSTASWVNFKAGTVELSSYDIHTLRIEAVVPGQFAWDYVQFQPVEVLK